MKEVLYRFKNKKNGKVIVLKENELNDFFKIHENKFYCIYKDYNKILENKNDEMFIMLVELFLIYKRRSKGKVDINEFIKFSKELYDYPDKYINEIKNINENTLIIDKNISLNEIIEVIKNGFYGDIAELERIGYSIYDIKKIEDDKKIIEYIFNKLDIYDYKLICNENDFIIKMKKLVKELNYILSTDENNKTKFLKKFDEIYNEISNINKIGFIKFDKDDLDYYYDLLNVIQENIKFCNEILERKKREYLIKIYDLIESIKDEIKLKKGIIKLN